MQFICGFLCTIIFLESAKWRARRAHAPYVPYVPTRPAYSRAQVYLHVNHVVRVGTLGTPFSRLVFLTNDTQIQTRFFPFSGN